MNPKETGIEELRALVSMANYSCEDAFEGLTTIQVVRLLQACRAMNLETLPDELTAEERFSAAERGFLGVDTKRRLYDVAALPETGRDWQ